MNRRNFIKGMLGTGLVTAGSSVFRVPLMSSAQATPVGMPTMVIIFQRGGCDGLNTVVPYGDGDYYVHRPSIAIPAPGSGQANPVLDLDGFFGLHPSMASLMPVYNDGNMAVFPTAHYPSPSRSHFSSQHYIESGISIENPGTADLDNLDGWINRKLQADPMNVPLQAVGFGSSLAQSLRGSVPVQSFSFIDSFNLGLQTQEQLDLINSVLPVYQQNPTPQTAYRQLVQQFGQTLFSNLDAVAAIDTAGYVVENGAMYPNGSYGRQLRETAQLIKDPNINLQAVTINHGGYDTHSDQGAGEPGGRLSRRLGELSDGIAALIADLGTKMDDVIVLVETEFGRTVKENGSFGTDHGNASSWFLFGNQVQGGIYMNGAWPGLAEENLYQNRYLTSTVDYRDILGDMLFDHMGHNPAQANMLFPGHTYNSLNLFSA